MVSQNAAVKFEPIMIGITKIYAACTSPFLTKNWQDGNHRAKEQRDDLS
jgi:hypothetical protein